MSRGLMRFAFSYANEPTFIETCRRHHNNFAKICPQHFYFETRGMKKTSELIVIIAYEIFS